MNSSILSVCSTPPCLLLQFLHVSFAPPSIHAYTFQMNIHTPYFRIGLLSFTHMETLSSQYFPMLVLCFYLKHPLLMEFNTGNKGEQNNLATFPVIAQLRA